LFENINTGYTPDLIKLTCMERMFAMKKLICEMCESTDLLKQDGVFVCQSCGAKYSVEDAKKMVGEGGDTGETAAAAKVDNTSKIENLYKLAHRAKEGNDVEKAAQYYEQISLENPNDWESVFYSTFYSAIQKWKNGNEIQALDSLQNCIVDVVGIISKHVKDDTGKYRAVMEVSKQIADICPAFAKSNENDFETLYNRYREADYSSNNVKVLFNLLQKTSYVNIGISKIYYALGGIILIEFNSNIGLDDMAKAAIDNAIGRINNNPCEHMLHHYRHGPTGSESGFWDLMGGVKRDTEKLVGMYNGNLKKIEGKKEENKKQRIKEYWDTHQSERAELEAEKKSLNEQIVALKEEITVIPQKTEGYIELQKRIEDLNFEKDALGFLKFKEKKAIQEQIDSAEIDIAPIQRRINTAIEEAKKRISSHENRIKTIDIEFANPGSAEKERINRERIKKRRGELSDYLTKYKPRISASVYHTVVVNVDGTVVAVGKNDYGQCNVGGWRDIVAVAGCTVGLKTDGTVVAVGNNYEGKCNVTGWRDIVAVAAGYYFTVGLKADGTVVVSDVGRCNVVGWRDIIAVAGCGHAVGLKADGTVVAVSGGIEDNGQYNVADWRDIVEVGAGHMHTVGLRADGTVVAVGDNGSGQCDVAGWRDIVAVAAAGSNTLGVKKDGTVVAVGYSERGQCNVAGWRDIVAVAASGGHTIGLKADGMVVAVGDNDYGQCNLSKIKM